MDYQYQYPWNGIVPPVPSQPYPYGAQGRWQQPQQHQQGGIQGVRWVSSIDEVNGTTLGMGESALFMFTGEQAFAVKSVSQSGVPVVKVFDFAERQPASPESYVTREEFEKLKEQINGQPAVQPAVSAANVAGSWASPADVQPVAAPADALANPV